MTKQSEENASEPKTNSYLDDAAERLRATTAPNTAVATAAAKWAQIEAASESDTFEKLRALTAPDAAAAAIAREFARLEVADKVAIRNFNAPSGLVSLIASLEAVRQSSELSIVDQVSKLLRKPRVEAAAFAELIKPRLTDLSGQMETLGKATKLDAYRLPNLVELSEFRQRLNMGAIATMLAERETSAYAEIRKHLDQIQTSWVATAETTRSIRAFTELQSIGAALKTWPPFDANLTDALRLNLGDWREPIAFDATAILEPEVRSKLFVAQGFDATLTDFPEPAFSAGLAAAELSLDYLASSKYAEFVPSGVSEEEAAACRRMGVCYQLLYMLERALRRFIDEKMTQAYGRDWTKHRLQPDMFEKWNEKAVKARAAGETVEALIDMADFTDYATIITKRDDFKALFQSAFRSDVSVRESFNRLHPLRLITMHVRVATKDDVLLLVAEAKRLFRAMGNK